MSAYVIACVRVCLAEVEAIDCEREMGVYAVQWRSGRESSDGGKD